MPIDLQISPGGSSPIFRQIVDQIRLAAATGKLPAGEQLPSVRALAEQLVVNPNTIAKAYAELAHAGVVDSQPGRGFFIAQLRQVYSNEERARRLEPLLDALIHEAIALRFEPAGVIELLRERFDRFGLSAASAEHSQGSRS